MPDEDADLELLAEQRDFYRADAEAFDEWLGTLLDEENDEPTARRYRAARGEIASLFQKWAPLGRVLEVAAGTGRLAPLYLAHAEAAVLLDTSPESLAIASRRIGGVSTPELVCADIFDWRPTGPHFDTVIFTAWLHHIPLGRFDDFWMALDAVLAPNGRVLFDYPNARVAPPGSSDIPAEPTQEYGFYAPADGISIRDHLGRRWRVVHNLWDPDNLTERLSRLGWATVDLGAGLFDNVRWAHAQRTAK